ncbi:hypothetical protein HAX54_011815 [Datura stramonium]|uniref:Uncharacterized protein n=1 Tax=Datura stramonium TaxID=4076 RepID=A0ABS8Y0N7_DATST|nr:hypothetical protein [Datura stramonium]
MERKRGRRRPRKLMQPGDSSMLNFHISRSSSGTPKTLQLPTQLQSPVTPLLVFTAGNSLASQSTGSLEGDLGHSQIPGIQAHTSAPTQLMRDDTVPLQNQKWNSLFSVVETTTAETNDLTWQVE